MKTLEELLTCQENTKVGESAGSKEREEEALKAETISDWLMDGQQGTLTLQTCQSHRHTKPCGFNLFISSIG